jgi:hypothetical protein
MPPLCSRRRLGTLNGFPQVAYPPANPCTPIPPQIYEQMAQRDEEELVNAVWIRALNNEQIHRFHSWAAAPAVRQVGKKRGQGGGGGADKRERRDGDAVVIGGLVGWGVEAACLAGGRGLCV